MTLSDDCTVGRSQHFTFPRRNFLHGLVSVVLPFLVSQPANPTFGYKPEFSIGDKIRASWVDESGQKRSQDGEIVGVCLHPQKGHWQYLVFWVESGYFDEYLTDSEGIERTGSYV